MGQDSASLKEAAARRAVEFIESGMKVGLGTGSTAAFIVQEVASRLKDGRLSDLQCVPTSERTESLARELGVPVTTLNETPVLDISLDGADEVTPEFYLIKGAGGALLREKIVAAASRRRIIVVDESKRVARLGEKAALPVEVSPFGWMTHLPFLAGLGATPTLRTAPDGSPFLTDGGHYILDCRFSGPFDPYDVQRQLEGRAGIVDHGLFLDYTEVVVVGRAGSDSMQDALGSPESCVIEILMKGLEKK